MGLVVLLVRGAPERIALGAASTAALAELGVTSVALVRGGDLVGLVLEGWAFDERLAGEAAAAVAAGPARALTTVARMALSPERPATAVDEPASPISPATRKEKA